MLLCFIKLDSTQGLICPHRHDSTLLSHTSGYQPHYCGGGARRSHSGTSYQPHTVVDVAIMVWCLCNYEPPVTPCCLRTLPLEGCCASLHIYKQLGLSLHLGWDPNRLRSSSHDSFVSGDPWWRHEMETFSALLAICSGNSPVPGEFPAQRPVTQNFDISLICTRINC